MIVSNRMLSRLRYLVERVTGSYFGKEYKMGAIFLPGRCDVTKLQVVHKYYRMVPLDFILMITVIPRSQHFYSFSWRLVY